MGLVRILWHRKLIISNYRPIFFCFLLLIVYLTLSVSQNMRRRIMRQLVNNDLKDMWKETLLTLAEIPSQNLPGVTQEILI
jgi:hypothetical protein